MSVLTVHPEIAVSALLSYENVIEPRPQNIKLASYVGTPSQPAAVIVIMLRIRGFFGMQVSHPSLFPINGSSILWPNPFFLPHTSACGVVNRTDLSLKVCSDSVGF